MEYQETMSFDIEKISSSGQKVWRSIYEVIDDTFFFKQWYRNSVGNNFTPLKYESSVTSYIDIQFFWL